MLKYLKKKVILRIIPLVFKHLSYKKYENTSKSVPWL